RGYQRQTARFASTDLVPEGATFIQAHYANPFGNRAYKLDIPSRYEGQKLPLIIMLHGGTQTADDFAGGTRMNVRAEEDNCLVAYPMQPGHANLYKCFNCDQIEFTRFHLLLRKPKSVLTNDNSRSV